MQDHPWPDIAGENKPWNGRDITEISSKKHTI
jgi:hypothetical protein